MDQKHGKDSESASSEVPKAPKRRRVVLVNSLPLTSSGRLNQIFQEISDRSEEAKGILVSQAVVDKQKINELESHLKEAEKSIHDLREAKDEMAMKNTVLRQTNNDLMIKNAELCDKLAGMSYETEQEKSRRNALEEMLNLQKIDIQEATAEIAELTSQRTSLWLEIQKLHSKRAEEERRSQRIVASHGTTASTQKPSCNNVEGHGSRVAPLPQEDETHHLNQKTEVVKAQSGLSMKKYAKLELIDAREKQNAEDSRSSTRGEGYGPRKSGVAPSPPKYEDHLIQKTEVVKAQSDWSRKKSVKLEGTDAEEKQNAEDSRSDTRVEEESAEESVEDNHDDQADSSDHVEQGDLDVLDNVLVHSGCNIYVSNLEKFFKIDWESEFRHSGLSMFECNKCPVNHRSCIQIQDHIWCKHYGERFKCVYCTSSTTYTWRSSLIRHIQKKHPSVHPNYK